MHFLVSFVYLFPLLLILSTTNIINAMSNDVISESKKCLLNNGIKDIKIFTYPKNGGSEDPKIIEEVSNHYEIARTGTEPLTFLDCSYSSAANSNNDNQLTSLQNKVSCTFEREQDKYTIEGWSHDAERKDFGYKDEELFKRFID